MEEVDLTNTDLEGTSDDDPIGGESLPGLQELLPARKKKRRQQPTTTTAPAKRRDVKSTIGEKNFVSTTPSPRKAVGKSLLSTAKKPQPSPFRYDSMPIIDLTSNDEQLLLTRGSKGQPFETQKVGKTCVQTSGNTTSNPDHTSNLQERSNVPSLRGSPLVEADKRPKDKTLDRQHPNTAQVVLIEENVLPQPSATSSVNATSTRSPPGGTDINTSTMHSIQAAGIANSQPEMTVDEGTTLLSSANSTSADDNAPGLEPIRNPNQTEVISLQIEWDRKTRRMETALALQKRMAY